MLKEKSSDIQILRGIAIILVLLYHLSITPTLMKALHIKISMPFWVGVELFFIISRFVVTKSIFSRPLDPLQFFIKRAFRLSPILLLTSFLANVMFSILNTTEVTKLAYYTPIESLIPQRYVIIFGYFLNSVSYANGAMWRLSIEFQFYAAMTVLVIFIMTLKNTSNAKKVAVNS